MLNQLEIITPGEDFYRNNITFNTVAEIKHLVEQYLGHLGVNYFTFDRTYADGSHIRLTSAGEWIEHYYRDQLYDVAIFEKNPNMFNRGVVFWKELSREPIYSEAALFDIEHGLTITEPFNTYCDFFHFGASRDNHIPRIYLSSKLDVLYNFVDLFRERTKKHIKLAEKTRFILKVKANSEFAIKDVSTIAKLPVVDQANVRRFYLGEDFNNSYLTSKELQVLHMLNDGCKLVDIAKNNHTSEKTIDKHIENIKNKLKCRTMFELGAIAHNLGIPKLHNPKKLS